MSNKIALTVEKSILLAALSNVQPVVQHKNPMPILGHLKLDAENGKLTISGTDMEILISETMDADIETEGGLTIGAKALYDIVRKMPDDAISIRGNADTGKVQIKAKGCRFSLPCLNIEEFPTIDRGDLDCELIITATEFLKILNKSKFAVSTNETQYVISGVSLKFQDDMIIADGTNGHRAARVKTSEITTENFPDIIIPAKTIAIISKAIDRPVTDFKIMISESKICILCDDAVIISKLIDGQFPDIDRAIPTGEGDNLAINRDIMIKALDRVSLASDGKTNRIMLDFKSGLLTVSANGQDGEVGEEDIEIPDFVGDLKLHYNSRYLLDVLSNIQSENVNFIFHGNKAGTIITNPTNENEQYLVLPMNG